MFVFKQYKYPAARQLELECYHRLAKYQNEWIPAILQSIDPVVASQCDPELTHNIAFSWVGPHLEGQFRKLPQDAHALLKQHVEKMHEAGVEHNDLRSVNMFYDPQEKKLWIYDFSDAVLLVMRALQMKSSSRDAKKIGMRLHKNKMRVLYVGI